MKNPRTANESNTLVPKQLVEARKAGATSAEIHERVYAGEFASIMSKISFINTNDRSSDQAVSSKMVEEFIKAYVEANTTVKLQLRFV